MSRAAGEWRPLPPALAQNHPDRPGTWATARLTAGPAHPSRHHIRTRAASDVPEASSRNPAARNCSKIMPARRARGGLTAGRQTSSRRRSETLPSPNGPPIRVTGGNTNFREDEAARFKLCAHCGSLEAP
jgi:hypothetical protein